MTVNKLLLLFVNKLLFPFVNKALFAGKARWDLRLTAWLLWLSKYGSSFWQEYIQTLPQVLQTCLICLVTLLLKQVPQQTAIIRQPRYTPGCD